MNGIVFWTWTTSTSACCRVHARTAEADQEVFLAPHTRGAQVTLPPSWATRLHLDQAHRSTNSLGPHPPYQTRDKDFVQSAQLVVDSVLEETVVPPPSTNIDSHADKAESVSEGTHHGVFEERWAQRDLRDLFGWSGTWKREGAAPLERH